VKKPIPVSLGTAYDWRQVIDYLEEKYEFKHRGFTGFGGKIHKDWKDGLYLDFWHLIVENYGVHNGGTIFLSDEFDTRRQRWAREILSLIPKEFPDIPEQGCYVTW
jgi:hypothetical protein